MAVILLGWASAEEGQEEEGIARMRQGLADLRATGAGLWRLSFLALLAAHGRVGRIADGLGVLDEAFAMTSRNGERAHEAELHRLPGELLLADGTADRRERRLASTRRSRSPVGRRRGRSSSAPRPRWHASTPTAADRAKAHHLLAPVHCRFTEGFSTADLREAKTLLEELASSSAPSAGKHRRVV